MKDLERDAMSNADIFGSIPEDGKTPPAPETSPSGAPRLLRPDRHQIRFVPTSLDALVEEDHRVRGVWGVVEKLDLTEFENEVCARGATAGRAAIDPRILVGLWLYGTSEGIGSARELSRLCEEHNAYRWICGGVGVNYHTLSDFRVGHAEALDNLMTQVLAVLTHEGMVELKRVAQDGMKIRASAGAASFRREVSLQRCVEEARRHVEEVNLENQDEKVSARRAARRETVAQERLRRVEKALEELPKVREGKKPKDQPKSRASTTDPEARVMKMGDGGYRPAYNAQFATDTKNRVIVGVRVTNSGGDYGQMPPMIQNIQKRTGLTVEEYLVDGGFAKRDAIQELTKQGITVYSPVQPSKKDGVDPHEPKKGDTPEVVAWRKRMATTVAKEIYKERAATAETTNADLRIHRALDRLQVRTLPKVLCVVLWAALTYNILRLMAP
jgi:transposase